MPDRALKIAVLSGKGGTGKTMVSVNLAAASPAAVYLDCDVEEPNGHLYFKPENTREVPVTRLVPVIDTDLCNGCRVCSEFCRFNALAVVRGKARVHPDVCHSCGGCAILCPQKAIHEEEKIVGTVALGISENVLIRSGFLQPGEASGIPVIQKVQEEGSLDGGKPIFIDCPPGSACAVMESIREADYCILVAEPTAFGIHNLEMVRELAEVLHKPYGVILNQCHEGKNPAGSYCLQHQIPILGWLPYDPALGALNADGRIAVREDSAYRRYFQGILKRLREETGQ